MLATSACVTPNPPQPAKEARPMTTVATTSASPQLNAEQVLRQLLNVIRDSENAREITSENLGKTMGVDFVSQEPGYHVFGEELTPEWARSEEHTSELQSLMRNSYAVFCLKKKK